MINKRHSEPGAPTVVACPVCQAEVDVELVSVLRPGTPELSELFAGRLNQGECQECGASFAVAVPLVYRDDQGRYLIYCVPLDEHAAWRQTEQRVAEMAEQAMADLAVEQRPVCRLTFHRRNLIEKIAIHQAGLDDRLVEYVKYQLYSRPQAPIDQVRSELLYDFSPSEDRQLGFLLFDRETGQPTAAAHIPLEIYRELATTFHDDDALADELAQLFPGPYVSVERLFE